MNNKYERLDETHENNENSLSTLNPILDITEAHSKSLSIRLLCKEKSHDVNVQLDMKVSELKAIASKKIGCPVESLRLVFNGKLLIDSKTLASIGIQDSSCIHVFPKPTNNSDATLPVATTALSQNNNATSVFPLNSTLVMAEAGPAVTHHHQPIHFDPNVAQTGREVKIWSYILLITSSYRLFGLLADMAARGAFGADWLDSVVQIIDAVCCSAGLYVGHLGVKSAQLIEMPTVRKYVLLLCILAAVNIFLQGIWVADVVHMADQMRKDQKNGKSPGDNSHPSDNNPSGDGSDHGSGGNVTIDDQAVALLGVQAVIIASIVTSIWFSCVMRARRFRDAVQNYDFEQRAVEIVQAATSTSVTTSTIPLVGSRNTEIATANLSTMNHV